MQAPEVITDQDSPYKDAGVSGRESTAQKKMYSTPHECARMKRFKERVKPEADAKQHAQQKQSATEALNRVFSLLACSSSDWAEADRTRCRITYLTERAQTLANILHPKAGYLT